jgi:preprotein translocase subunit SecE
MARASSRSARIISTGPAGRVSPVTFLQETLSELRKSVWPSREETTRLTIVVIALSIVMGFFLGGLDRILKETFDRFVLLG